MDPDLVQRHIGNRMCRLRIACAGLSDCRLPGCR
jgi:hypothetical protein